MNAVISCTFVRMQTLADATPRIVLDCDCSLADLAALNLTPGATFALARLTDAAARDDAAQRFASPPAANFGEFAKALYLSSFVRSPDVWRAIGTDEEFRMWLRDQTCAFCKAMPPNEAAHVRAVANGAGMGIKPEYSSFPCCRECHQKQHNGGYGPLLGIADKYAIADEIGRKRVAFLHAWGWHEMKRQLSVPHMNEADPAAVLLWAQQRGVDHLLPREFKEVA